VQKKRSGGVDYVGLALIAMGLGCMQVMMDRGEDDDWFGSNFIRLMALLAFLGICGAIGWLLIAKKPIVSLMVFKDRNYSVGCMLIATASVIVYASAVAVPAFAQQVLPYTATWAGLVLSPGGIALMVLIPIVTMLERIVQPRYVIALGFLILGCGHRYTNIITRDIDFRTLVMMRTLQSGVLASFLSPSTLSPF
jgi:DHA2 family multidrug resistance protein